MFTQQANQIELALRLSGAPPASATEMVRAIANGAQPLEHRGPAFLSKGAGVHRNTFPLPRGVTLPQSQSKSHAPLEPPKRDPPLWFLLPISPPPTDTKEATLIVKGPAKVDDLKAGDVEMIDANVRGLIVGRDIGVEGGGRFGGGVNIGGPVNIGGQVNIDGRVTNHNTVINRTEIINEGPVYNQNEVHHYGPTHYYGNTYVGGTEVKPFPVTVVVDVLWTGTVFQKVTRQIMAVSQAGPTATATVLDCTA